MEVRVVSHSHRNSPINNIDPLPLPDYPSPRRGDIFDIVVDMPQHDTRLLRNKAQVAGHDTREIHGTSFQSRGWGHFALIVVPARSRMKMR